MLQSNAASKHTKFTSEYTIYSTMPPSSTNASSKTCHLLVLPAEIRNLIWELLVSHEKVLFSKTTRLYGPLGPTHEALRGSPPITRVSQQIRAESLSLYFALNTFAAKLTDRAARLALCNVVDAAGPHAADIRKIEFEGHAIAMMGWVDRSHLQTMHMKHTFMIDDVQQPSSVKVAGEAGGLMLTGHSDESVQMLHDQVAADAQSMERRIVATMEYTNAQGRGFEIWSHVLEWSRHLARVDLKRWAPGF
ncbi:hypothetical protein CLAFUW4_08621 [Fulvia fulva]|uniref:Uncharacterized protein n=1 Tax=Passalora fulva TaxID=5499 RepID=A0A9Q8LDF6_PASFU|nr:uncharacterized protein CLAFUR5_08722 [Fulvia fulva]KAK4630460.1 hypothetical protein CLAFUR0_08619 [Fulvia fulva]UJO15516.1 hypothetical protein CLAFUR5_08722 [Fulvia fulva]WPV13084.1 hypothetical protein CLAFUW4_08621 [Fulvia fulva]